MFMLTVVLRLLGRLFLRASECEGILPRKLHHGSQIVSAMFVTPYPPGFPILVPGQIVSRQIVNFIRRLDVSEVHGYRADLGLRIFTREALDASPAIRDAAE